MNKKIITYLIIFLLSVAGSMKAQNSSATAVTRKTVGKEALTNKTPVKDKKRVIAKSDAPSADIEWMRVIYRHLDLENEKNAALYYPGMTLPGQDNLFRIIMKLIASGKIKAYEYLDGREVFTDEFQVQTDEMLARFHIPFSERQSNGNKEYVIEAEDLPADEIMSYYVLEQWEFDNVKSRTTTRVLALCPILHQTGEFGDELKYPMFWVEMDELTSFLTDTAIFIDDSDNTLRYSYNDFFTLTLYDGDIYKTRNVRNKSMAELYPDETARKHASDSIQNSLKNFDKALWAPSREEVMEAREAKEKLDKKKSSVKSEIGKSRRPTRTRGASLSNNAGNSGTIRSVKDRK